MGSTADGYRGYIERSIKPVLRELPVNKITARTLDRPKSMPQRQTAPNRPAPGALDGSDWHLVGRGRRPIYLPTTYGGVSDDAGSRGRQLRHRLLRCFATSALSCGVDVSRPV